MSWTRVDLSAAEVALPPAPPSIFGFFYSGARHVVSGEPEALKTLCVLAASLGHVRTGNLVALLDFEQGPNSTRERLISLGASSEELARFWYVEPQSRPTSEEVQWLVDGGVDLVVIDAAAGAYHVSELDDNQRRDAEAFAQTWIDPFWRCGVATIVIDHVPKSTRGRGKAPIGSERKLGQTDVHLGLEVVSRLQRGGRGLVRVATHKDRIGFLPRPFAGEIAMESDPETHRLSWEVRQSTELARTPHDLSRVGEAVSRYLEAQGDAVSRNAVEKGVAGSGALLRRAMDQLVADGFVEESRGLRGARLMRLVKPFRTSSDVVATLSDEVEHLDTSSRAARRGEDEDGLPGARSVRSQGGSRG